MQSLQTPQPCCCGRNVRTPTCSAQPLSFRASIGNVVAFRAGQQQQQRRLHPDCRHLKVDCAINRATKEKRVAELEDALRSSSVAFGVRFNKVSVKDFESFRRSLPAECKLYVAKNTLLRLAADRVDGWSELKQHVVLENAWVFAPEDAIAASVKAFLDFEKRLLEPIPKAERSKFQLTDISGGAMDGKFLDAASVRRLEKMPNKLQLLTAVAVMIKKVPTKVAVSIKQVPAKVAYGIKALAEADDDKSKLIGDVLPKAA